MTWAAGLDKNDAASIALDEWSRDDATAAAAWIKSHPNVSLHAASIPSLADQYFLCGLFNSLVVNYLVRLRVNNHVTTAVVEGLPIPGRHAGPGACREVAALARLLTRRADGRAAARLQALVAGLYQLSVPEFAHVVGTFPLIRAEAREAALKTYQEAQRCGLTPKLETVVEAHSAGKGTASGQATRGSVFEGISAKGRRALKDLRQHRGVGQGARRPSPTALQMAGPIRAV